MLIPMRPGKRSAVTELMGVQGINTSFDRLELLQVSDEQITARFWLYYSCDNYADETLGTHFH